MTTRPAGTTPTPTTTPRRATTGPMTEPARRPTPGPATRPWATRTPAVRTPARRPGARPMARTAPARLRPPRAPGSRPRATRTTASRPARTPPARPTARTARARPRRPSRPLEPRRLARDGRSPSGGGGGAPPPRLGQPAECRSEPARASPAEHQLARQRGDERPEAVHELRRREPVLGARPEAAGDQLPEPVRQTAGEWPRFLHELREAHVQVLALARPLRPREGHGTRQGVMQGCPEPPHVGGRADLAGMTLGIALFRRHVGIRADRLTYTRGALERPGDAQVDQARRNAHHDVVGLHVQVRHAVQLHVVQGGAHVRGERQQLLQRDGAAALDQPPQRRALQVLEQDVRARTLEHRVEAPHDDRVGEPREDLRLVA